MKTRLLALAMVLCTFAAKAQYVTIPDPAFALFLQQTYPNCMNGNQMDTTCSEIVNETAVNCSHANIYSLEGIQYFDSLLTITCSNNNIASLPILPPYLNGIDCDYNNITALPDPMPASLWYFNCRHNNITVVPQLPSLLYYLDCSENNISVLPTLHEGLQALHCGYNPISVLPALPLSLGYVNSENTQLTSLPTLPNGLGGLNVGFNQLSTIPTLPTTLISLVCDSNNLQSLPLLPPNLRTLSCGLNQINTLPLLPDSLKILSCGQNPLNTLTTLPLGLEQLYCNNTEISSLPSLPLGLSTLSCGYNNLQAIPTLPNSITQFFCPSIGLDTLPTLPAGIELLVCGQNNITQIPSYPSLRYLDCFDCTSLTHIADLQDTMDNLNISGCSNLHCIPMLKYVHNITFFNSGITCLPNAITVFSYSNPSLDTFPICNQFNNPNGCPIYARISGQTYADRNNNCAFDSTDEGQFGLKHSLFSNGVLLEQTYSNNVGNYSFDETALGNYETRLDTTGLPFIIACPTGGVYYDTLTTNDSTHFNRDFALQCEAGFDLAARSVASAMVFRPANNTVVDIHAGDLANFYSASCAQGVSGVVTVTLHGPISYISPATNALTPSNVTNNILTWNVADFGAANALNDFNIIIQTDTFAQSGQQACFDVSVTPLTGDNDTSNNHLYFCFDIVNSYDPNDKTAYPSGNIDTTQEWLTYRVRFQNTGTAEAQHIYIMDTLDVNVKVETFQLLSYSHQPNVQINENIVRFNFPNINLPDSTSDEPGSHGYVQYKVKLKEDLTIGTAINNTAYIYFDFNPPVVTNTATNTIAVEADTVEVGIKPISKNFDLLVYPNPANQQLTVTTSEAGQAIAIYNTQGKLISTQTMQGNAETLHIAALPSGVYYIEVSGKNIIARKKFVKL